MISNSLSCHLDLVARMSRARLLLTVTLISYFLSRSGTVKCAISRTSEHNVQAFVFAPSSISFSHTEVVAVVFTGLRRELQTGRMRTRLYIERGHHHPGQHQEMLHEQDVDFGSDISSKSSLRGGTQIISFELKVPPMDFETAAQEEFAGVLNIFGATNELGTFNITHKVTLTLRDDFVVLTQTDRTNYRPREKVNIRFVGINGQYRPEKSRKINVWIESPDGLQLFKWTDMDIGDGLLQHEVLLPGEAPDGKYKIYVVCGRKIEITTFEVRNEKHDFFEVSVDDIHPVFAGSTEARFRTCALTADGRHVGGRVIVEEITSERAATVVNGRLDNGCLLFVVNLEKTKMNRESDRDLRLSVEVTDDNSGHRVTKDHPIIFERSPLKLTFLGEGGIKMKPGLPLKSVLKVSRPEPSLEVARNEVIRICVTGETSERNDGQNFCNEYISGNDGLIHFVLPPVSTDVRAITIVATAPEYKEKVIDGVTVLEVPTAYMALAVRHSPVSSFVQIKQKYEPISCQKLPEFDVFYNIPSNVSRKFFKSSKQTFTFLVNCNNRIRVVGSSSTAFKRASSHFVRPQFVYEPRKGSMDKIGHYRLQIKQLRELNFHGDCRVLIFYFHPISSEMIGDILKFTLSRDCLQNSVSLSHEKSKSGSINLQIKAELNSVCSVTIMDKSSDNEQEILALLDSKFAGRGSSNNGRSQNSCSVQQSSSVSSDIQEAIGEFISVTSDEINAIKLHQCSKGSIGSHHEAKLSGYELDKLVADQDWSHHIEDTFQTSDKSPGLIRNGNWTFQTFWLTSGEEQRTLSIALRSATKFIASAFCISLETGLGISHKIEIGESPGSLLIDMFLPAAVVRGEKILAKIEVRTRDVQDCAPIALKFLDLREDVDIKHDQDMVRCLCSNETTDFHISLRPLYAGRLNVTIEVRVDFEAMSCTDREVRSISPEPFLLSKEVRVELPGAYREQLQSMYICPDEFEKTATVDRSLEIFSIEDTIKRTLRGTISISSDGFLPSYLKKLFTVPIGDEKSTLTELWRQLLWTEHLAKVQSNSEQFRGAEIQLAAAFREHELQQNMDGSFGHSHENNDEDLLSLATTNTPLGQEHESSLKFTFESLGVMARSLSIIAENPAAIQAALIHVIHSQDQATGCWTSKDEESLTALTAAALIELYSIDYKIRRTVPSRVLKSGVKCLQDNVHGGSLYDLAIMSYAAAKGNHTQFWSFLRENVYSAATAANGTLFWTQDNDRFERRTVQIAAYYVLAALEAARGHRDKLNTWMVPAAVAWLLEHLNSNGGFTGVEDTIIGMKALHEYAKYYEEKNVESELIVYSDEWDSPLKYSSTNYVIEPIDSTFTDVPTTLNMKLTGNSCIFVQLNLFCSVIPGMKLTDYNVRIETRRQPKPRCRIVTLTVEVSTLLMNAKRPLALNIQIPSGFEVEPSNIREVLTANADVISKHSSSKAGRITFFIKQLKEKLRISLEIVETVVVGNRTPSIVALYDSESYNRLTEDAYSVNHDCDAQVFGHPASHLYELYERASDKEEAALNGKENRYISEMEQSFDEQEIKRSFHN